MASIKQSNTMSSMSSSSSQSLVSNVGDGSNDGNNGNGKHRTSPGFAYVIYENEFSVRALVSNCIEDYQNGRDRVEYYFKISTRRVRNKEVQIIPWILADNNFATCTLKDLDPKKTVFVGNLHGTMTARDLAHIMNELFGSVVYAGIDIDKLKYPIGSGRVTFAHQQNFMRAVRAAFVDIQSSKFSKRIQIDPYLEDVPCCLCASDKVKFTLNNNLFKHNLYDCLPKKRESIFAVIFNALTIIAVVVGKNSTRSIRWEIISHSCESERKSKVSMRRLNVLTSIAINFCHNLLKIFF